MNILLKYKNWIIAGGLIMGATIIGYYLFKKDDDEQEQEITNIEEGNKIVNKNGLIFSKPVSDFKYPLIYVFGGMYYANPEWMLQQIPSYLKSRAFIVLAPYTTSFSNVKKQTEKYLSDNNISINPEKISIAGFSAGGLNVQNSYNNTLKVAGLIDPSTRSEYLDLPFTKNAIMVYNENNWGYPNIKATLPKLDKVINDSDGIGERVNIIHKEIPKYFFEKYQNKFL